MTYEEIKHKLPSPFINKPNTVILVDDKGEPWVTQNKDGTFSGLEMEILGMKDERAELINNRLNQIHRHFLWPNKPKK